MRPKIFISSTYEDLKEYRNELWSSLKSLNVKIYGMEKFGARPTTTLQTCLSEVENCDVYIGIFAYRYGSIEEHNKKSYTQLEYEKAIEKRKEVYIYLLHEDALIQPKYVDIGHEGILLQDFKITLKKSHTCEFFLGPADLAFAIFSRLMETYPALNGEFRRPRSISCKLFRFPVNNNKWLAFVGQLRDVPFEIFVCPDYGNGEIPPYINNGKLIEVKKDCDEIRYDFEFHDRYGYKNTVGGINRKVEVEDYHVLNTLLKSRASSLTLLEVVDRLSFKDVENPSDLKRGIKNALGIRNDYFDDF